MAEADRARDDAQRVLDGDRYQARDVPRPLRGVLRWIGDRLEDAAGPIGDLLATPAGAVGATLVVALLAAAGVVLVARRRNRSAEVRQQRAHTLRRVDPRALDREADGAEADGDLGRAVRLRFRAGVLRLEEADVVPRRADATTRRLVAAVPSAAFAPLAVSFDEIAYGQRPARATDVEQARRGWPRVLAESEREPR